MAYCFVLQIYTDTDRYEFPYILSSNSSCRFDSNTGVFKCNVEENENSEIFEVYPFQLIFHTCNCFVLSVRSYCLPRRSLKILALWEDHLFNRLWSAHCLYTTFKLLHWIRILQIVPPIWGLNFLFYIKCHILACWVVMFWNTTLFSIL